MVMPETIGGYPILDRIGSGGFGTVYRAYSPSIRCAVALKTLEPNVVDAVVIERFRREALLTSEINHPNVIDILDADEDGGVHFIVMEMMPLSLRDALSAGSLPMSRAMDICRQAALGLKAAQTRGIYHRDIKPDNILIGSNGTVKVSDFGIAHADDLPSLTTTGTWIGAGRYMSPEQFMDSKGVDARTDIYSLGVTLYEMLTGKQYELRESAKASRPAIPGDLERIVNKCLEMDRENRYASMDDLLQEITNSELINRCVLIDIYEAMGGPNWKRNDNWLTDEPLNKWYGLDGNKEIYDEYYDQDVYDSYDLFEGHYYDERRKMYERIGIPWAAPQRPHASDAVWGLVLEFNNLEGIIPPEVGLMADLKYLGLNNNPGIVGPFPPELWDLKNLEDLNLSNTRLSGTLPPPDLGRFKDEILNDVDQWAYDANLRCINLSNCRFTGDMPLWLPVDHFPQFEDDSSVYLSGNNWTGTNVLYGGQIKDSDKIPSLSSRDS